MRRSIGWRATRSSRNASVFSRRGRPMQAGAASLRMLVFATFALAGCRCAAEPKAGPSDSPAAAPQPPRELTVRSSLAAVWGTGRKDVWAVGANGTIVHFDGKAWSVSESGTTQGLTAVAGTAPDDVWAVGEAGTTLHFDGKAWSPMDPGAGYLKLLGVWASSKTDVWVAGIDENVGLLRHYDGKVWGNKGITASTSLWEAWGSGNKDIWMVGSDNAGAGFVLRGDGTHFDRMPFEGGSLRSIWGTGAEDVWVAAYSGELYHWDGAAWTASPSPPAPEGQEPSYLGVWGTSATDVWVVGFDGAILHHDGKSWTRSATKNTEILWSAWGSAPDDVWVVGNAGTILHWNGHAWSEQSHDVPEGAAP